MTLKTSTTHPLEIDAMPCGNGCIGMTRCPGKKGGSRSGGRWNRDLSVDIGVIRDWGATALVSLVESSELDLLEVPELAAVAQAAGLEWHHLPIVDVRVPDADFERLWTYSGHVLRARLTAGERIVVHCRGGYGRTGTVAARLAIEFGEPPAQALARVRASRKWTVETREQEAYVLRQRPVGAADADYADRVLGCLLGGAVGDALGYEVEFDSLEAIRERFGPQGIQAPVVNNHGEVEVSDDTQMTLFTAAGLLSGVGEDHPFDRALEAVREETLNWHAMQRGRETSATTGGLVEYAVLGKSQAPGNTCLGACALGAGGSPEQPINDSKGCGGVMRVAPVGLCLELDANGAFELAARCAAQTHGHPSGYLTAGVLAAIVRRVVDGSTLREATESALDVARRWDAAGETVDAVEQALELAQDDALVPARAISQLGQGWVGDEALAIGLYSALVAPDFVTAVRMASNHDGDSDSTASIAGQIHGAWKGLAGVPHDWIRRLDVLDPLLDVADRTIAVHGR